MTTAKQTSFNAGPKQKRKYKPSADPDSTYAKRTQNAEKALTARRERQQAMEGKALNPDDMQDAVAREMARLNAIEFSPISFLVAIAEAKPITLKAYRINPKEVTLKIRKEAATDVLPYLNKRQPIAPSSPGGESPESVAEKICQAVRDMGVRTSGSSAP